MTNSVCKNAQNVLVHFHIGCGGRFHNSGHKTYVSTVDSLSDCFGDANVISTDVEGNALPDKDWQLIDSGDNVRLEGREEIEAATGVLDWDGDYDTDIVKRLDDCTDEELELIVETYNKDGGVDDDVLDFVCDMLGYTHVHKVRIIATNMEIFANEGAYDRISPYDKMKESWEGSTEEEFKDWLLNEVHVLSYDLDKIIVKTNIYSWFDE